MNYPQLKAAATQAARYIETTWQEAVSGAIQVPGIPALRVNQQLRDKYAKSIHLETAIWNPAGNSIQRRVVTTLRTAQDLEDGKGPWDMKPMLLGGPKAKVDRKGNRYVTIPFRHGVPGASKNSWFKPMPEDVYKQVKPGKMTVYHNGQPHSFHRFQPSLAARDSQGKFNGKTIWGDQTKGTEANHPRGANPTTGYEHKAGIYEGMYRIQKTYRAATQSKYFTFRRVSSKSDPLSWWHPGYPAYRIAHHVAQYCQPTVNEIIAAAATQELEAALQPIVGIAVTRG